MKKRNIIFGVICFLMLFVLTGCGNKKAITAGDFKTKTEQLNYTTTNITSRYASYNYIKEAIIAQNSAGYQVEFYVLDNVGNATSMFNTNKTTFESYKGSVSTESSTNIGNYSSYTLTSSGYYMHLCRVDNTLLYIKVKETYKDSVKSLIKQLGY